MCWPRKSLPATTGPAIIVKVPPGGRKRFLGCLFWLQAGRRRQGLRPRRPGVCRAGLASRAELRVGGAPGTAGRERLGAPGRAGAAGTRTRGQARRGALDPGHRGEGGRGLGVPAAGMLCLQGSGAGDRIGIHCELWGLPAGKTVSGRNRQKNTVMFGPRRQNPARDEIKDS